MGEGSLCSRLFVEGSRQLGQLNLTEHVKGHEREKSSLVYAELQLLTKQSF